MQSKTLILQIVMIISLLLLPSHGHPSNFSTIEGRSVPCDPIEKYTVDWFVCHSCKRPSKKQQCLFYTRGLSEKAKKYASANEMTSIWVMWPKPQYNKDLVKSNPLRCIFGKKDQRQTYFEHMSIAMAVQCDLHATVMDPTPGNVRMDGIFGQQELPALKSGTNPIVYPIHGHQVDSVEAINPDGGDAMTLWKRGSGLKRDAGVMTSDDYADLFDRGLLNPQCGHTNYHCGIEDDDTAAAFDEGGELPVDW